MRIFLSFMRDRDFSEVLDTACRSAGLDPEAHAARPARDAASRLRQLADQILELAARASQAANALDSYIEHQSESEAQRARKPSDLKAIADELHITADMTFEDLSRLRRQFASANHPDRADCSEREDATRRMMIANMLIDRELERRHSQQSISGR
jgi:hypothetical protein